jgi:hypothetical protein
MNRARHKRIVIFLTIMFFYPASSFGRPKCAELEPAWYSRYVQNFKINWDTDKFKCPGREGLLAQSLNDLEKLEFRPNKDDYSPNFYNYVRDSLKETAFDPKCEPLAMALQGKLILCRAFFEQTRENRASTLVHEARHMDPNAPGHETCIRGAYKGDLQGCDAEFHDGNIKGGSFNAEIYYLNWVIKRSKQNELSKSVHQSLINDFVPDRFNQVEYGVINKWREQ